MTPPPRAQGLQTYVILLRGINVGGANALRMTDFKAALEATGGRDVRTYIQSGNAVFRAERADPSVLSKRIAARILRAHGVRTTALILFLRDLQRAVDGNPFPQAVKNPKTLHLCFLGGTVRRPDLTSLEAVRGPKEQFRIQGRIFYLYAPDGIGRSKLATRIERALGVPATARNWRTCQKLLEIARAVNEVVS